MVAAHVRTLFGRFLIAAALLHGSIPVLARVAPEAPRLLVARSSRPFLEVEVEVEPATLRRPPARRAPGPEERAPDPARDDARLAARDRRREERDFTLPAPTPDSSADPTTEPGPPPDPGVLPAPTAPVDEYGGPPPPEGVAIAPGLGGAPIWQIPGVLPDSAPPPPAPTVAPRRPDTPVNKAGELLSDAMRAKDKGLGLDLPAAGTVASAVVEAVRAADTPPVARTTFEVQVSGAGKVLSARMVSTTAGAVDLWSRVASAAVARLASRKLAMTAAFTKGARIYVSVVSSVRMPSGATSGVQVQGAGAAFDLSDIGAHASRVISSSFKVVAIE